MASVNKVILIGNLGKDPELRFLQSGQPVANFSIATSEKWKDKNTGESKEQTEWHNIIMFGKLAEISGQYLKKGSSVFVEGRLQTRKWQDKNGQDRYTTEIIANKMKMLGGRGDQSSASNSDNQRRESTHGYYQPPTTQSARNEAMFNAQSPAGFDEEFNAQSPAGFDEDDIPFN